MININDAKVEQAIPQKQIDGSCKIAIDCLNRDAPLGWVGEAPKRPEMER